MYASKFTYNGHSSEEFGIIIGSIDNNDSFSGGEVEVKNVQSPGKDEFDYFTETFPNVLVWNFTVIKYNCDNINDRYLTVDEERHIIKWLMGNEGYHDLVFNDGEHEDIHYMVYFNATPCQIAGRTVGYNLTATSNCGYGFTKEYVLTDILNSSHPIQIQINNDLKRKVMPYIIINSNGSTKFTISNNNQTNIPLTITSKFSDASGEIVMDSKNDIITNIPPSGFNYEFLYFIDGMNTISTDSDNDINVTIKYRENRRVIV